MASSSNPQPVSCGVIHGGGHDGQLVNLPLNQVVVNALIVDGMIHSCSSLILSLTSLYIVVSARVTLTQVFYNPSRTSSPRAKYVFPLPAKAAVCAFEMRCDDRVITGIAKERQQAEAEHAQAVQEGKSTALVEWVSDDSA